MKHRMFRAGAVVLAAAVGGLALATPASAHVRSGGSPLPQGGYGIVELVVPGETDGASTVGLTVTIPDDVNLTSARTQPIPGWTANAEREQSGGTDRVSRIVWTATDPASGYGVGEYQVFSFSAGPWPEGVDSVALPSDQSYTDGSVVSWNEVAVDESSEPEHPAPEVALVEADAGHGDGHGAASSDSGSEHHDVVATSDGSDRVWQTISVVSLVLAVAAVAGLGFVLRRGRGAGS
ncbi:YcnI family copper-binding membrane protein [Rhodococcoides kyotonense]|uniref:Uncharacterized protein YcnI n=1 Tax=Rhodococcoides kyotonense TaxID=398843 RepID=A0A239H759_9NOCA|nr:YcnI family protein [Rhodococcus kyotonensis]SNS77217.1 Uncharacterized protein YcnI [Rhodococcus kyotonensis]